MLTPLSAETIALVQATVPALAAHGQVITRTMYRRLFVREDIRALFNQANQGDGGAQVHALAAAILAYAQNIDNLGALTPVVERVAHKHVGFHILPEHYPFVADALLGAIAEVLGDAATPEIIKAWGEAYWFLAEILKGRETAIRGQLLQLEGGWTGWRAFAVADKVRESSVITSFVLRPVDGKPVLRHRPGQYLTLRFGPAGAPAMKRNYSISCAPNGDHYRISVKREAHGNGGSRFLHDQIRVGDVIEATPPAGEFFLPDVPQRPVVLLSGGVGLTPMISMLETIAADHPGLEAHYIHGTLNSATHAMHGHVRSLAKRHGRTTIATFYSDPQLGDAPNATHDVTGYITADWLRANAPIDAADIYLCGPKPFLRGLIGDLARVGVPPDRIHFELFGPTSESLAA
ncbi:NO-inducible flavohemoprotein [Inquilinus sp.]|jgi:nitric oxide dioxygenase|uniref:NO-inducible flavohemoprotein n=1 Tax=Inquilinus sp. TaxID=1932117 RepID=UPI0037834515